jgi:hypothetical protein
VKKVLMILTSHRLDCLKLCIDLLVSGGSAARFDTIAILCSGVEGRHKAWVEALPRLHPNMNWAFEYGPRGRGKPISDLQNACIRRFPDALYFKLDEDTFVSRDWDLELVAAYERFKDNTALSLITPVVTNNQRGAYHLLTSFPELGKEFSGRFKKPIVTDRIGPVWHFPQCAEFVIRSFLRLDEGNARLRALNAAPFETFSYPFSINCLCYDYRHWLEIGGVPEFDETGWGEWIPKHNKFIVLATRALVHHYAFFVQQDWLDRTNLLEAIRAANVPGSPPPSALPRLCRIARQIPGAIKRKLVPEKK